MPSTMKNMAKKKMAAKPAKPAVEHAIEVVQSEPDDVLVVPMVGTTVETLEASEGLEMTPAAQVETPVEAIDMVLGTAEITLDTGPVEVPEIVSVELSAETEVKAKKRPTKKKTEKGSLEKKDKNMENSQ